MAIHTVVSLVSMTLLFSAAYSYENHHNNHRDDYNWGNRPEIFQSDQTTELPSGPNQLEENAFEKTKQRLKMSLGVIISIPIVGIIFLVCCCYCICRCCCGACQKEKIVVMQTNVLHEPADHPLPTHTQIFVQQPIYQPSAQHIPSPYEMQQQNPQQWGPPHQQYQHYQQNENAPPPQYYAQGGIYNPTFNCPTAPPGYVSEKH